MPFLTAKPRIALSPRLVLLLLALIAALVATSLFAQGTSAKANAPTGKELVVATHVAPPFVMRDEDGHWYGLAITLWDNVARDEGLRYRLVDSDLAGMISGVADGRYDASAGALTITPEREEQIDFTHPYYTTGFGIAVRKAPPVWMSLLGNFFSWQFMQAVLALAVLLLVVGALFWLAERRRNPDQFGGGTAQGLGSGFWFSAVTMTTVGYGDKAPVTPFGRFIALAWMFAGIIIISTFTGMIASSLTAGRLAGSVSGPADLPNVKVGSIRGTASDQWLSDDGVNFRGFKSVEEGLAALKARRIDAFVYDKPIVRYQVRQNFGDDLRVLSGTFGRQDYGIALPNGSPLREAMNVTLLEYIEGDGWQRELNATLGRDE